jgi:hypothetical protein
VLLGVSFKGRKRTVKEYELNWALLVSKPFKL